jgi:hypothetical protein
MSKFPAFINPESSFAGWDFGGLIHREIGLFPVAGPDDDDHEGVLILSPRDFGQAAFIGQFSQGVK